MSLRAIALLALASAAGCGSPAADSNDAGLYGSFETDYCVPMAELVCERAAACGCGVSDEVGCVDRWRARCVQDQAAADPAGHTHLVLAGWRECLDRFRALDSCAYLPFEICPPVGVIDVEFDAGPGACIEGLPCGDGSVCVGGACMPLVQDGAACTFGFQCAPGLYCSSHDFVCRPLGDPGEPCPDGVCADNGVCLDGTCAVPGAVGASCTSSAACETALVCDASGHCAVPAEPCTTDASCGRDATCTYVERTCEDPIAMGAPCALDFECGPTGWCDGGVCGPLPSAGQPCVSTRLCGPGASCSSELVCVTDAGLGERCDPDFGPRCASHLGCIMGRCDTPPSTGAPCSSDHRCAAPAICDQGRTPEVCVPPGAEGDGCNVGTCGPGLACDPYSARCAPGPAIGAACHDGEACTCLPDETGISVCRAPPLRGDPCDELATCPAGLVCRSTTGPRCLAPICSRLGG